VKRPISFAGPSYSGFHWQPLFEWYNQPSTVLGRPFVPLPQQTMVNNDFPQPVIADRLDNTGGSGDEFPQSSLDVYRRNPFLIRAIFRFPNAQAHRQNKAE